MLFNIVLLALAAPIAALSSTTGSKEVAGQCGYKCLSQKDCSLLSVEAFSLCIKTECDSSDMSVTNAIEDFISGCRAFNAQKVDEASLSAMDGIKDLYISSQMAIIKRQAAAVASNGTAGGNSTNGTNGTTTSDTTTGAAATTSGGITSTCTDLADVLSGACIGSGSSKESISAMAVFAAVVLAAAL